MTPIYLNKTFLINQGQCYVQKKRSKDKLTDLLQVGQTNIQLKSTCNTYKYDNIHKMRSN